MQVIETHAAIASTNAAPIESKHSSLRPQLAGRSTQTWPLTFPMLSVGEVVYMVAELGYLQRIDHLSRSSP